MYKKILNISFFYNLYQTLIGCKKYLRRYATDFLKVSEDDKVLDLGCGTATMLDYLPKNIKYTGIDYSLNYIQSNKKKYKNSLYNFICKRVAEEIDLNQTFDIVYSEALMASIDDK